MIEKYRVSEVAKDLGTSTKEIANLLNEKFPDEQKKSMTVLKNNELNYLFESMTQEKNESSLNDYFAMKKPEPKPEKKEEPMPCLLYTSNH